MACEICGRHVVLICIKFALPLLLPIYAEIADFRNDGERDVAAADGLRAATDGPGDAGPEHDGEAAARERVLPEP